MGTQDGDMPTMKNTVLIFCDLNGCGGGVYVYTQQIAKAFVQCGASVFIISHEPHGSKEREFLVPLMEGVAGYRLIPNNITDREIVKFIVAYAEEVRPTWFFPNYREGPHAAMVPLKKMGVGNIFVCHNDHESQYRYAFRYQSVIDLFICPSKKCESFLLGNLGQSAQHRVQYIPHCVDIMADSPREKTGVTKPVKLLYCGRINFDQKKLDYLPGIMKALELKGVDAVINLVGSGGDRDKLEQQFIDLGVQNFRFFGRVDRSDLSTYFQENDIVVLTSLYEGFCLALAEVMGSGLPAVAFECGGVIDDYLVDNANGYIVPFGDVDKFTDKIQHLVMNSETYTAFSRHAQDKIQSDFSWDRFLENYGAVVRSQSELEYSWPLFRSIYMHMHRFSFANIVERIGKTFLKWS